MGHTPGPWTVAIGEECCFHQGNRVAIVKLEPGEEPTEPTIAEVWPGPSLEQDIADATLIAAAPEMLEALKVLLANRELGEYESQKQGLPRMIEANDLARQAIAKAEGKKS